MKTSNRGIVALLFAHAAIFLRLLFTGKFGVRDAWMSADEALDAGQNPRVSNKKDSRAQCRSFLVAPNPADFSREKFYTEMKDWPTPTMQSHSEGQVTLPFSISRYFSLRGELLEEIVTLRVGTMQLHLRESDWASMHEVKALRIFAQETVEKNPV